MKPKQEMPAFFWHYLRGYAGWAMLAAAGILVYAAATAGAAALIKPIFGEVLLAGERVPGPLGSVTSAAPERAEEGQPETGVLADLKKRFDLAQQIDRSYQSVKRRLGIDQDNVVYFVPFLFVLIFLLRSLSDFISGYAFQNIGLGVTTDIRNDLYRRILE
ncbi:MAG TPA: hypothetical protein VG477_16500, partial [Thermoanaerobaculia bacterium]|nr:hypothetical protein [Thermoanaerobaculia bacterium]